MLLFTIKEIPSNEPEPVGYTVKVYTDNGNEDTFQEFPYRAKEFCEFFCDRGHDIEQDDNGQLITGEKYNQIKFNIDCFCHREKHPYRIANI